MSHRHSDHPSESSGRPVAFAEKAHKLIDHWVKHNDDHARNYQQWAGTFRENGLVSAAALLDSAAELTDKINRILAEAEGLVDSSSGQIVDSSNR